ncbi:hypothetical protein [Xenorhabdus littoralis]|nr:MULTISPECIES: hypothetical protein [unclassified Xenorhabdus]
MNSKNISEISESSKKEKPVLHILCGKIASGKSTLSAKLAQQPMN